MCSEPTHRDGLRQVSSRKAIRDVVPRPRFMTLCKHTVACICVLLVAPTSAFISPLAPGCWQPSTTRLTRMLLGGNYNTGRKAPSFEQRKKCTSLSARQLGGEADDVQVLRIALDQKRNEELMGGQLQPDQVEQLRRYAVAVSEKRSPVSCDTLGLGEVMEGRWRLALSSEYAWFLSMLPSADVFMDVDCQRQELAYVLQFRGKWLLLQQLKLLSKYDILQGGSQLAMLFCRMVLVIASKPISFPIPSTRGAAAWKQSSYFDGDLWLERCGRNVNVLRYHGPREAAASGAGAGPRPGALRRVGQAVRGAWGVAWRVAALAAVTMAGAALILPPLLISYAVAALVLAFSPFRDKSSSISKSRLHRA